MNVRVTIPTEETLKAHYAAIRKRLNGPRRFAEPAVVRLPEPIEVTVRPEWRRWPIKFDAHVQAWQMWRSQGGSPARAYIKRRCEALCVAYREIVGPSRRVSIIAARHQLIWEIRQEFPQMSFPEIGRLFGGRDHTTIMSALKKMSALNAAHEEIDA